MRFVISRPPSSSSYSSTKDPPTDTAPQDTRQHSEDGFRRQEAEPRVGEAEGYAGAFASFVRLFVCVSVFRGWLVVRAWVVGVDGWMKGQKRRTESGKAVVRTVLVSDRDTRPPNTPDAAGVPFIPMRKSLGAAVGRLNSAVGDGGYAVTHERKGKERKGIRDAREDTAC